MNQDDQTKTAQTVPDMAVNQLPEAFLFYQLLFQKSQDRCAFASFVIESKDLAFLEPTQWII